MEANERKPSLSCKPSREMRLCSNLFDLLPIQQGVAHLYTEQSPESALNWTSPRTAERSAQPPFFGGKVPRRSAARKRSSSSRLVAASLHCIRLVELPACINCCVTHVALLSGYMVPRSQTCMQPTLFGSLRSWNDAATSSLIREKIGCSFDTNATAININLAWLQVLLAAGLPLW